MIGGRRRILAAACRTALMLTGLAWALLAAGCGKRAAPPPVPPPETPVPTAQSDTLRVTDSRIEYPDSGPRIWVAEAGTITASAQPGVVKLTTVSCRLYRNGQETLRVRADAGDAVQQDNAVRMTLTGNVRAEDIGQGLRLTADKFEWASQHDRISAVNVQWLGGGFVHRADRGTFTTDLTRATFEGRVSTRTVE
jgi:hypothetical protein